MRRIVLALLTACCLCGACLTYGSAATGQFVAVEIDVFTSWGILNWGAWDVMDARLLSVRMSPLPSDDAAAVAEALAACDADASLDSADRGACQSLERIGYVRLTDYRLTAMLGRPYRIRIRNLTAGYVGVVLAVDGLNTNGNAPIVGDASDRKWILRPLQEVAISGWQVSATEALRFEFGTPSESHSSLDSLRGVIRLDVYPADPFADEGRKGTQAGQMIDQPTVVIPFASVTTSPVETLNFDYSRDRVILGIQCAETDGAGIAVAAVVDGTAAQRAGLRAGDIITYANAVPINTCSDLQSLLATKRPGDRLVLKVHRPERVFLLTLELEE
jgi:hypothetical protein